MDRNDVRFNTFDYNEIGGDEHIEEFIVKAEEEGIITPNYRISMMRHLRAARHGNAFYRDW